MISELKWSGQGGSGLRANVRQENTLYLPFISMESNFEAAVATGSSCSRP